MKKPSFFIKMLIVWAVRLIVTALLTALSVPRLIVIACGLLITVLYRLISIGFDIIKYVNTKHFNES